MTVSLSNEETIAAIGTAVTAGQGGIAVIRLSGQAAEAAAKSVLVIPGKQHWKTHSVLYGHVTDHLGKERIDEVLVLIMKGPRSFTGEDVVEIHCHGGLICVQRVLERLLAHPAVRRAEPGEFSQRAVLNGRIDLTQAEAISELITARSHKAAKIAMAGLDGGIQKQINALRERLLDQLAELEARVDFEDELPKLSHSKVLSELEEVQLALKQLIEEANRGMFLRQGLRVALIGRPNVGKSSLLNRLSRRERAIVTDLPGTTRDVLESEIILQGVPITLIDTAGIRETKDSLEQLGIAKSHETLISADVVVMIFDLSTGWAENDQLLKDQIPKDLPILLVGNKADLSTTKTISSTSNGFKPIRFSALTGQGEESLINAMLQTCDAGETNSLITALNERQKDLAVLAISSLEKTKDTAKQGLPWDFWTIDLRQAIHHLGQITGEDITEALLGRIFSKFCIGK